MQLDKATRWLKHSLQYEFSDQSLFEQALTHRSAPGASNERLEFLGDAVLDLVISECVFSARPDAAEGELSRLRSHLVKDSSLATLASDLGLGEHLILGGGEKKSGGHRRASILADAIEAIIGAVYLDAGFDAARAVIELAFARRLAELPPVEDLRDAKTRLQEWLQARQLPLPDYDLVNVSGKAHRQVFEVGCRVQGLAHESTGHASSRRAAEQEAASAMIEQLRSEPGIAGRTRRQNS